MRLPSLRAEPWASRSAVVSFLGMAAEALRAEEKAKGWRYTPASSEFRHGAVSLVVVEKAEAKRLSNEPDFRFPLLLVWFRGACLLHLQSAGLDYQRLRGRLVFAGRAAYRFHHGRAVVQFVDGSAELDQFPA
jgi:hypothetical protein